MNINVKIKSDDDIQFHNYVDVDSLLILNITKIKLDTYNINVISVDDNKIGTMNKKC